MSLMFPLISDRNFDFIRFTHFVCLNLSDISENMLADCPPANVICLAIDTSTSSVIPTIGAMMMMVRASNNSIMPSRHGTCHSILGILFVVLC